MHGIVAFGRLYSGLQKLSPGKIPTGSETGKLLRRKDGSTAMSRLITIPILVFLVVFSVNFCRAEEAATGEPEVIVQTSVPIPMRDGIKLGATIYRPKDAKGPVPVLVHFTPYTQTSYAMRMWHFLKHGYAVAMVDVRGRGNSEGDRFKPFATEGPDGYDVVEWLAAQPWCNAKVAMYGGSYTGWVQWITAAQFPPHLVSITPSVPTCPGTDFPMRGNIFTAWIPQWLVTTSGRTDGPRLPWTHTIAKRQEVYLNPPFSQAARIIGDTTTEFSTTMQHPAIDAYWDAMNPTQQQYGKINLPVLAITGYYDGNQLGALTHFRNHNRLAPAEAAAKHYLVIGPWDHRAAQVVFPEVGGIIMPKASTIDLLELHRAWFDWTMKDGPKPEFLKKRVAYFAFGAEPQQWKYADSLETITDVTKKLYLNSVDGKANDPSHCGSLQEIVPQPSAKPDKYTYDPLDTRPMDIEREGEPGAYNEAMTSIHSTRYADNLFGSGLVYETEPFEADTEITGIPKLVLWISMDVPDTDFIATLHEILPNEVRRPEVEGQSFQLSDMQLRARYRESQRKEKLVVPGEITRFEFRDFWFFSRRFAKGSRLRLVFRSPNSIHYQKNYNSGGAVAEETAQDARTAHVTVYHDAGHPSYLEIPVVE